MDINKFKHIHFIGIKGVGMANIARALMERGVKVTGSDVEGEFITDEIIEKAGIKPILYKDYKEYQQYDFGNPDYVVITGAHGGMTNPEAVAAKLAGLKTIMYGEFLGKLMNEYKIPISVAGCHGKTTTASIIAHLLSFANTEPSFIVGTSNINSLETAGKITDGEYFVAEADEYKNCPYTDPTPKMMYQKPKIAVITNVEFDHPDMFRDLKDVEEVFGQFMQSVPENGMTIFNYQFLIFKQFLKSNFQTFGTDEKADWRITKVKQGEQKMIFNLQSKGIDLGEFILSVPGVHNCLNATAAIAAVANLGIDMEKIRQSLPAFIGTKRRFEKIGEKNGVLFYDDYAHHPTEIKATLRAAKQWFGRKRIICIFQPHTYSRTKSLFREFANSFGDADKVIFADIFSSARETKETTVSSQLLAEEAQKYHKDALYLGEKENVLKYLVNQIKPDDVVFTMGAGDIYLWQNILLSAEIN